jgi:hypothetical protein
MPSSGATNYPATTIASDPYQKMPLSGTSAYSAEPQDMQSHMPTSMPSMQLSMVSSDQPGQHQQQPSTASHQVPPIRTQYASYVPSSNAPPPLSVSSAANSSLSVPRYVDDGNPRPTKSPRHPSIHAGSISSTESSGEYRYGPPYSAMSNNSAEISPQTSQHASYSTTGGAGHESSATANTQSSSAIPPPRDYFPPSTSWTTTAGESNAPTYTNGDHRSSYPYSADQYKTAGGVKSDPHAPPPPVYPGQAMSHYSWNTS